jgi:hypothetical protein
MKSGAHDYIMKGNLKRLLPAIDRELREAKERRERRRAEDDLRLINDVAMAVAESARRALSAGRARCDACARPPAARPDKPGCRRRAEKCLECMSGLVRHRRRGRAERLQQPNSLKLGPGKRAAVGRAWQAIGRPIWLEEFVARRTMALVAAALREAGLSRAP